MFKDHVTHWLGGVVDWKCVSLPYFGECWRFMEDVSHLYHPFQYLLVSLWSRETLSIINQMSPLLNRVANCAPKFQLKLFFFKINEIFPYICSSQKFILSIVL